VKRKDIPPFDPDEDCINVIVETPKGSRNKYSFDKELSILKLGKLLPAGMVFPFDFGAIPSTLADDGDPLDVLVLMGEPVNSPCMVQARLIGVIEAQQGEDGQMERNDRLIAITEDKNQSAEIKSVKKLDKKIIEQIEHFFSSYNEQDGKQFKVLAYKGPQSAVKMVKKAHKKFKKKSRSPN
jgi:inorganic pyrophosphatase